MMIVIFCLAALAHSLQLLSPVHPFNLDISCVDPVPNSAAIINDIAVWGTESPTAFRITRDLVVGEIDAGTVWAPFVEKGDYYDGECDAGVTVFPLPASSAIEGRTTAGDYSCYDDGDCHILVIDRANATIWEGYSCDQPSSGDPVACTCVVKWYMCGNYPYNQRGTDCTSADAAGFSVAALTLTPKEVAEDDINHALRFTLDNDQIRANIYGYPGTHSTSATSGGPNAPWYGARLRLRAGFDESSYGAAAQRILRALKRYGMFLADGGNIPMTFANDFNFDDKWEDLLGGGGNPDVALYGVNVNDFEVMPPYENIALVSYDSNCVLVDVPQDAVCGEILSGEVSGACVAGGSSSSSANVHMSALF